MSIGLHLVPDLLRLFEYREYLVYVAYDQFAPALFLAGAQQLIALFDRQADIRGPGERVKWQRHDRHFFANVEKLEELGKLGFDLLIDCGGDGRRFGELDDVGAGEAVARHFVVILFNYKSINGAHFDIHFSFGVALFDFFEDHGGADRPHLLIDDRYEAEAFKLAVVQAADQVDISRLEDVQGDDLAGKNNKVQRKYRGSAGSHVFLFQYAESRRYAVT